MAVVSAGWMVVGSVGLMTVLSAGLMVVVSAVDDGFASLWRDHLAPLVIGIDSSPVQKR